MFTKYSQTKDVCAKCGAHNIKPLKWEIIDIGNDEKDLICCFYQCEECGAYGNMLYERIFSNNTWGY